MHRRLRSGPPTACEPILLEGSGRASNRRVVTEDSPLDAGLAAMAAHVRSYDAVVVVGAGLPAFAYPMTASCRRACGKRSRRSKARQKNSRAALKWKAPQRSCWDPTP